MDGMDEKINKRKSGVNGYFYVAGGCGGRSRSMIASPGTRKGRWDKKELGLGEVGLGVAVGWRCVFLPFSLGHDELA